MFNKKYKLRIAQLEAEVAEINKYSINIGEQILKEREDYNIINDIKAKVIINLRNENISMKKQLKIFERLDEIGKEKKEKMEMSDEGIKSMEKHIAKEDSLSLTEQLKELRCINAQQKNQIDRLVKRNTILSNQNKALTTDYPKIESVKTEKSPRKPTGLRAKVRERKKNNLK